MSWREEWRSVTMEYGEQFATMAGMKEMQLLSAISLDLDNQVYTNYKFMCIHVDSDQESLEACCLPGVARQNNACRLSAYRYGYYEKTANNFQ